MTEAASMIPVTAAMAEAVAVSIIATEAVIVDRLREMRLRTKGAHRLLRSWVALTTALRPKRHESLDHEFRPQPSDLQGRGRRYRRRRRPGGSHRAAGESDGAGWRRCGFGRLRRLVRSEGRGFQGY